MGAEKSQELTQQARWFEDQVATRQFVIGSRSESAEHQLESVLLQNLIVNLRTRQSRRSSEAFSSGSRVTQLVDYSIGSIDRFLT